MLKSLPSHPETKAVSNVKMSDTMTGLAPALSPQMYLVCSCIFCTFWLCMKIYTYN